MVKKETLAFFALILLLPFITGLTIPENTSDQLGQKKEQLETFINEENKTDYLSSQWTTFLENNESTKWIYKLNPLFKFMFGHPFSISSAFLISFLIWAVLFSLIYPPIKVGFRETLPSFGISFVTSSLIVQLVTPNLIKLLSKKITTLTGAFLTILSLIVLIVIINRLSKIMMAYLKKKQEEKKINRLETESEKEKKIREGIESIKKGAEEFKYSNKKR